MNLSTRGACIVRATCCLIRELGHADLQAVI